MGTQTLDSLKVNLIARITKLGDEKSLRAVSDAVDSVENRPTIKQLEMLKKLVKPTRKKTDINEIIKEQNWKGINREKFDRLIKKLDIQEPLEQLIVDIGK